LGFDQYTGITYTNKEFIENAISYLVDGEGLIDIRSRELKVRLLDATKVNKERVKWQVINTVIPIALIIVLGLVMAFVRKKKYSKTEHHEEK
jgi:ABC-2 type transport system permease protein